MAVSRLEASPFLDVAKRALALVRPRELEPREERLLGLAEQIAREATPHLALRDHAAIYLALACTSLATRPALTRLDQDAALVAALALGATARENLREVMGLHEKLRQLVHHLQSDELRPCVLELVRREQATSDELLRSLEAVVVRLEAAADASP